MDEKKKECPHEFWFLKVEEDFVLAVCNKCNNQGVVEGQTVRGQKGEPINKLNIYWGKK